MIHKLYRSTESDKFFPGIQSFVNCIRKQCTDSEVSNVVYVEIISEKADSKQTLLGVIGRLQTTFVKEQRLKYVIVCGDGKTYAILQEIKEEYQSNLQWLLPFPGDWHILLNYQKALMKPYADAGISTLASAAGYRAETLTKLLNASNFKKTHDFLLQLFEAMYRFFLSLYINTVSTKHEKDYSKLLYTPVANVLQIFHEAKCDSDIENIRKEAAKTLPPSIVVRGVS